MRTRTPILPVRDDPIAALLIFLPPALALLALLVPRFPINPIATPAVVLLLVVIADAPRWRLSRVFWGFCALAIWPVGIAGYVYARRLNGAPMPACSGLASVASTLYLAWRVFAASGKL